MKLARRRNFTAGEVAMLRRDYATVPTRVLAQKMGRARTVILYKARQLGLTKNYAQVVHKTEANPSPKRMPGSKKQMRRGRWKPVGSTRVNGEGNLEKKVSDFRGTRALNWKTVSTLVWEAANGPVPPGSLVLFKDGMKTTVEAEITADKLVCMTREAMLATRNSLNVRYPREVVEVIQLAGALKRKINNRRKQHGNAQ